MGTHLPTRIISHKQKVCSLYKRALRNLESYYSSDRIRMRYEMVLMRDRFDQNAKIRDPARLAKMVTDGEEEIFKHQHWQPKKWPNTIGGNAYGREPHIPDWVLDFWHPLEKAQYPEYFARREKRKEEFIKMWEKEFSKN